MNSLGGHNRYDLSISFATSSRSGFESLPSPQIQAQPTRGLGYIRQRNLLSWLMRPLGRIKGEWPWRTISPADCLECRPTDQALGAWNIGLPCEILSSGPGKLRAIRRTSYRAAAVSSKPLLDRPPYARSRAGDDRSVAASGSGL